MATYTGTDKLGGKTSRL